MQFSAEAYNERFEALKTELAASDDQSWRTDLAIRWATWRIREASRHFANIADHLSMVSVAPDRELLIKTSVDSIHAAFPSIMNCASLLIGGVELRDPAAAEATMRLHAEASAPREQPIEDTNDSEV